MTDPDNGILASIPGQYVAAATHQLLDPVSVTFADRFRETEMDVPGIGRVRFFAEAKAARHKRSTIAYWTVNRVAHFRGSKAEFSCKSLHDGRGWLITRIK